MRSILTNWLRMPYREDAVFGLTFLLLLLVPLAFFPLFVESYETAKYPLFLLFSSIGFLTLFIKKEIFINKIAIIGLILLWIFYLLSTIFSLDIINSLVGLVGRYTNSLFFITAFLFFVVLIWNAVKGDENRRLTLLRVLVFDGIAIAILGLFQSFGYAYYGGTGEEIRTIIPSFTGNQNYSSMFLVAVIPAIIILFDKATNNWARYYYISSAILVTLSVITSGSRGAILGLVTTCVIFLGIALLKKFPIKYTLSTVFVLVLCVGLYLSFNPYLRSPIVKDGVTTSESTIEFRYIIWGETFNIISRYPFLGTGTGNFPAAIQFSQNPALVSNYTNDDVHNLILQIAVTIGLPAIFLFISLFLLSLARSWRNTSPSSPTSIWVISSMVGVLIAACFNPVSIAVWVVLGLLIAFGTSFHLKSLSLQLRLKILPITMGVIVLIASILFIFSETFYHLGLAKHQNKDFQGSVKLLKLSLLFNPTQLLAPKYLVYGNINNGEDPDRISKQINEMSTLHPLNGAVQKNAGDLYYLLYTKTGDANNLDKMDLMYKQAMGLYTLVPDLYVSVAYGYYKSNRFNDSINVLNRGLLYADDSQSFYICILKAKIYLLQGQKEEGLKTLKRANGFTTNNNKFIKNFIGQVEQSNDVANLPFPVHFPEIQL